MLVLNVFCMSGVRRMVSKALLMSIMAKSILCAGFEIFSPSCMYYVNVARSVVIESRALKPCFVGDKGVCGVIVLKISLSRILIGLQNKEIGL